MSATPLPVLALAAAAGLAGLPFLRAALRRAARVLPAQPRPAFEWRRAEIAAVVAAPILVLTLLSALLSPGAPEAGEAVAPARVLLALLGTQLVFGAGAALALVLAARRSEGLASLGLARAMPAGVLRTVLLVYLPGYLVIVVGLGAAWAELCRSLGWEERQEVLSLILALDGPALVVAALVAVFVGPLIEELVFRGFLQGALAQVGGERLALVLTSALFARMHGLAGLPILFALSLFLGWLQQRTRCLWVPWFAHALNNAVMLTLALGLGHAVETPP